MKLLYIVIIIIIKFLSSVELLVQNAHFKRYVEFLSNR